MSTRARSNEELIAQGRTYTHQPKCMCGLCVYSRLFTAQTKLKCECSEPEWIHFSQVKLNAIGTFCGKCGNLHYTTLATQTYECEGCGKFCSYDFRQFLLNTEWLNLPLPVTLCRRCDVPVSPSVNGRSKFRIN